MSRLERLSGVRDGGKKALVPFLTGGYPDRETFVDLLFAFGRVGADTAEVGIPFSDPSADGPVIQKASERALAGGATVSTIFEDVAEARRRGLELPLLTMTYYNPILATGPEAFASRAVEAGLDGVLVVDLPAEEAGEFGPLARGAGLDTIHLVAPTTPEARIPKVVAGGGGFVYCVSVAGVTGQKKPVADTVAELVGRVRRHSDLPALVGFGVSDPASARAMAGVSDGVIVGSALLQAVGGRTGAAAVSAAEGFLRTLREAL